MSQNFQTVKEVENAAKTRMDKALADMQHAISQMRTGRASVNILEPVTVEAYGSMNPLNHVATLHVPEPALITVQPFDVSLIGAIEKAIRNSNLGLNPGNDGKLIRIPIPPLNEERRKELVKQLHVTAEDHRVSMRNVRRDANESVKKLFKDKLISEDDEKRAVADIQKLLDETIKKLDGSVKTKENDVLQIK